MTTVGRNDTCPCGSGKKFKRCCGASTASLGHSPPEIDRHDLTRRLIRFLGKECDPDYILMASKVLFADLPEKGPPTVVAKVLDSETSRVNLTGFALYDALWHEDETVAERFLEHHRARLTPLECRYLEAACDSHVGLYEISEVVLDEGVRVLDLLSGESIWVRERQATHYLARWDLVAARLLRELNGDTVFLADLYRFPQDSKSILLKNLRAFLRLSGKRRFDAEAMFPDLKFLAPFFFQAWWHLVACPPPPKITNFDGHVLALTILYYDVTDARAIEQGLNATPELEAEESGVWIWSREIGGERRIVARVALDGTRLTLETNSAERSKAAKALLEGRFGSQLRCRFQSTTEMPAHLERMRGEGRSQDPTPNSIPAHVQDRVRLEYMDRHYHAWIDQPVPMLANRTPRHAAKLRTQRHKVIDLLKGMENSEAHAAQVGEKPYDFGWMWTELGLQPTE